MTLYRVDLLDPTEVAVILAACHRLRALPDDERLPRDRPHAGTHHLDNLAQRIPLVGDLVQRPSLLDRVVDIIGPDYHVLAVSYRSPQPGFGGQRLHADGLAKMDTEPDTLATAIVPLVAFTKRNGSTRCVPGSHRRPDLQRHSGQLESHPDEVLLTGRAGHAFVFSGHLLHSGTKNESDAERPALQIQWQAR